MLYSVSGRRYLQAVCLSYREVLHFAEFPHEDEVDFSNYFHLLLSLFSMGTKRSWQGQPVSSHIKSDNMDTSESAGSTLSIFENFRNELDEHHDRRERIIKASRDITALSKKMCVLFVISDLIITEMLTNFAQYLRPAKGSNHQHSHPTKDRKRKPNSPRPNPNSLHNYCP